MFFEHIDNVIDTLEDFSDILWWSRAFDEIKNELIKCRDNDGTIYIIGNGGSASTASHFASDLLKTAQKPGEKPFRAICPTDNISSLTAWSNDDGFVYMFSEFLKPRIKTGDILIILSSSGNSGNLVLAASVALDNGAIVISVCGIGGKILEISDIPVEIPTKDVMIAEDIHLVLEHAIVKGLR